MVEAPVSRDEFIEQNLPLVHNLCKRFRGRGIEYDDLYQAGCMGLVKAADGFECERGLCFSTYAVPVILGEIRRLFRDGGAVKISRSLKELSLKVSSVRSRMLLQSGEEPTVIELSMELGVAPEEITEAIDCARAPISLTVDTDEGSEQLQIPTASLEDELGDRLLIEGALESLSETERQIVRLRYFQGKTQSNIAEILSMSQVQISRAEKKILLKLRKILED